MNAYYKIAIAGLFMAAHALEGDRNIDALTSSGPETTNIAMPDPAHVEIVFGKDMKWSGGMSGAHQAPLFGDPSKPGIYGVLIKWDAGHYSHPHFHTTDRYAYVVSGTWWVSASTTWDPSKAYPVPAGSYVRDLANQVHWDGARDKPVLIMLVGEGPMTTTAVPETKP
jgi:hypothetical protein